VLRLIQVGKAGPNVRQTTSASMLNSRQNSMRWRL